MKQTLFCVVFFCCFVTGNAQVEIEDNPSYTSSPHKPYLDDILSADVLRGRSEAEEITPNGQKICFDKRIKVKTQTLTGPAEICLFINTKIGLVAYSPLKPGGPAICDINPSRADFNLSIIGLKGNTYNYYNYKKKGVIEHFVTTSNSQRYLYQHSSTVANAMLHKKDENKEYCDRKVKGWAYRYENRAETWYLFGKSLPDAVILQPNKYLGNFGIGYQYSDKGLIIIMEVSSVEFTSEIVSMEEVWLCFDPSAFRVFEDEHFEKSMSDIQKKKERLDRQLAQIKNDGCENEQRRVTTHQYEMLRQQEQNLQTARQGNTQQSITAQTAQANTIINYDEVIVANIYDTRLKICRTNRQLEKASGSSLQRLQQKLTCLNTQLTTQMATQAELRQVNTQYPRDPGKQFTAKARIYVSRMSACD
jgi:hypothetical protein